LLSYDAIKQILEVKDKNGRTALMWASASAKGRLAVAQLLVDAGANVNAVDTVRDLSSVFLLSCCR
jgi:ankyrin repeat protein